MEIFVVAIISFIAYKIFTKLMKTRWIYYFLIYDSNNPLRPYSDWDMKLIRQYRDIRVSELFILKWYFIRSIIFEIAQSWIKVEECTRICNELDKKMKENFRSELLVYSKEELEKRFNFYAKLDQVLYEWDFEDFLQKSYKDMQKAVNLLCTGKIYDNNDNNVINDSIVDAFFAYYGNMSQYKGFYIGHFIEHPEKLTW